MTKWGGASGAGAGVLRAVVRGERLRRRHTAQAGRLHRPRRCDHLADKRTAIRCSARCSRSSPPFSSVVPGLLASVPRSDERATTLRSATVTARRWVALLVIVIAGSAPLNALVWPRDGSGRPQDRAAGLRHQQPVVVRPRRDTAVLLSVLAPMIVIWRWRALPRWLLVLGAAEIIANIVELGGLFSRTGANAAGYGDGVGSVSLGARSRRPQRPPS